MFPNFGNAWWPRRVVHPYLREDYIYKYALVSVPFLALTNQVCWTGSNCVHIRNKVPEVLQLNNSSCKIDRNTCMGWVPILSARHYNDTTSEKFSTQQQPLAVHLTIAMLESALWVFLRGFVSVTACFGVRPISSMVVDSYCYTVFEWKRLVLSFCLL